MAIIDEKLAPLNRREHNEEASAKRVVIRYQDPNDGEWYNYDPNENLISRYDYSSSTTIYVGQARPGTASSEALWTITKYDLGDSSDASGLIAENAVWDDRASEVYA